MSNIICVTDRKQCCENFLTRIERIAEMRPHAIILREKDLDERSYEELALQVLKICEKHQTTLMLNGHFELAQQMGLGIQLSYSDRERASSKYPQCGVSVHSVSEASSLAEKPLTHLIAGHIWPTACKESLPPRGETFLRDVCEASAFPVFAIGGVTADCLSAVASAGAFGACMMSSLMTCPDPGTVLCGPNGPQGDRSERVGDGQ